VFIQHVIDIKVQFEQWAQCNTRQQSIFVILHCFPFKLSSASTVSMKAYGLTFHSAKNLYIMQCPYTKLNGYGWFMSCELCQPFVRQTPLSFRSLWRILLLNGGTGKSNNAFNCHRNDRVTLSLRHVCIHRIWTLLTEFRTKPAPLPYLHA